MRKKLKKRNADLAAGSQEGVNALATGGMEDLDAQIAMIQRRRGELAQGMQRNREKQAEIMLPETKEMGAAGPTGEVSRSDGRNKNGMQEQGNPVGRMSDNPATYRDGENTPKQGLNDSDVAEARQRALDYKAKLEPLYRRLRLNEEYYRQRYSWTKPEDDKESLPNQSSGYLVNSIINKTADIMDNYPEANILPREKSDEEAAKILSKIIPVIQKRNHFRKIYYKNALEKVKNGFSIFGTFWDPMAENGMGEVRVEGIDPIHVRWEPGVEDIQDAKEIFVLRDYDNDVIEELFPDMRGKTGGSELSGTDYLGAEEKVDRTDKSTVYDWYYKKTVRVEVAGQAFPKTVLHYAKFCNGKLLFASENDERYRDGWYQDGKYPFVFDVLYPVKSTVYGFGMIDMMRQPQEFIDRVDFGILTNVLANCRPRYFVKEQAQISEEEFLDYTKPLVHYTGGSVTDIRPMDQNPLPPIYQQVLADKKEELKENTGNRDFSQGTTSGGVTAASAIAALQEASSKTSRTINIISYSSYEEVVGMMISRMRQFYTIPRTFRIVEENKSRFETISAETLNPEGELDETLGTYIGGRVPIYDIDISAQKQSPYSKIAENELAKELFQLGVFNPELADQAIPLIRMMDFDKKAEVLDTIAKNQQLYVQNQQMRQLLAGLGPVITQTTGNTAIEEMFGNAEDTEGEPLISHVAPKDQETNQLGETDTMEDRSTGANMRRRVRGMAEVGGAR